MPTFPGDSKAVVEVISVRDAWLAAVRAGDIGSLLSLVTDDIVMMHPRRSVSGDALKADLERGFQQFRVVDETVTSYETVVAGDWAFDRGRAHTTLADVTGGEPSEIDSEVVTILRRESDGR